MIGMGGWQEWGMHRSQTRPNNRFGLKLSDVRSIEPEHDASVHLRKTFQMFLRLRKTFSNFQIFRDCLFPAEEDFF